MQIREFIEQFEKFALLNTAIENDPTGIQIGDKHSTKNIKRMLITLDVRPEVVEEAIKKQVDFIFAHHPVIFRSIKNFDLSNPQNRMYAELIKHNITVYSAHTNLDVAVDGMNDWLADQMGLNNIETLITPTLNNNLGRVGELSEAVPVKNFALYLKQIFELDSVRMIANDSKTLIQKVAVIGGDGGKFYQDALNMGCDVMVTGDVYYHTGHDMLANNLSVIDVGHNVEKICIPNLARIFENWGAELGWNFTIIESETNTNPFTNI